LTDEISWRLGTSFELPTIFYLRKSPVLSQRIFSAWVCRCDALVAGFRSSCLCVRRSVVETNHNDVVDNVAGSELWTDPVAWRRVTDSRRVTRRRRSRHEPAQSPHDVDLGWCTVPGPFHCDTRAQRPAGTTSASTSSSPSPWWSRHHLGWNVRTSDLTAYILRRRRTVCVAGFACQRVSLHRVSTAAGASVPGTTVHLQHLKFTAAVLCQQTEPYSELLASKIWYLFLYFLLYKNVK